MQRIVRHNQKAWDIESDSGESPWCVPVAPAIVEAAKRGDWEVFLTPQRPVPRDWFGDIEGARVLCLASGGGQQVPVLAAAGARVTSFDLSAAQLDKDRVTILNMREETAEAVADAMLKNPKDGGER